MILENGSKIWIYGFGARGKMLAKRLEQEEIKICGYIDQQSERYRESVHNVPILKPDEINPESGAVMICALSNVFAHEEIAKKMAEKGFRYIIYKSFSRNEASKKMNILYDDLTAVSAVTAVKGREVLSYMDVSNSEDTWNMNHGDTLCINIPVELLFGLTRELLEESLLDKDEWLLKSIPEQSLLYYTLPKRMMQFFTGETDEMAWSRCKKLWFACRDAQSFASSSEGSFDKENQEKNLEDRYIIFQKMERLFCDNPVFFHENPISVTWNAKGWFHIQDGNNRAAFLLAKGVQRIPARLSREDYEAWLDAGEAIGLVHQAKNNLDTELRSPILHPLFENVPCTLEFYSHRKTAVISDWLWRKQIDPIGMTACEYYCENDLCGSHIARMGGYLTVYDTKGHLGLHKALDKLYHLKQVCYRERIRGKAFFDVILSNRADALEKLIKSGVRASWYILEYIDRGDAEIEELLTQFQLQKREYLMCQLVGGKIYKVVAAKGEN